MKTIAYKAIVDQVAQLCIKANVMIGTDILSALKGAKKIETSPVGKNILEQLLDNAALAEEKNIPICQDTGMTVVFVELGQDVQIEGGLLNDAINEGVRFGYETGYLRKSVVGHPLLRINTNDNTPAVIHYDVVSGDYLKITVAPKGFGSENMSRIVMLKPSDGVEGVKKAVLETIDFAGPNACPPMIVGVGIGGTFEKAALLSKQALLRPVGQFSHIEDIKILEIELKEKANSLGIGPQGLGGLTTVLDVHIEIYPTHIAGLPVAINIGCHVTRHETSIL